MAPLSELVRVVGLEHLGLEEVVGWEFGGFVGEQGGFDEVGG